MIFPVIQPAIKPTMIHQTINIFVSSRRNLLQIGKLPPRDYATSLSRRFGSLDWGSNLRLLLRGLFRAPCARCATAAGAPLHCAFVNWCTLHHLSGAKGSLRNEVEMSNPTLGFTLPRFDAAAIYLGRSISGQVVLDVVSALRAQSLSRFRCSFFFVGVAHDRELATRICCRRRASLSSVSLQALSTREGLLGEPRRYTRPNLRCSRTIRLVVAQPQRQKLCTCPSGHEHRLL
jgi:hypothetical protein